LAAQKDDISGELNLVAVTTAQMEIGSNDAIKHAVIAGLGVAVLVTAKTLPRYCIYLMFSTS